MVSLTLHSPLDYLNFEVNRKTLLLLNFHKCWYLNQFADVVVVFPLVAVVVKVGLEAHVGLGHRPVDPSFDEGKVRARAAPDLENL